MPGRAARERFRKGSAPSFIGFDRLKRPAVPGGKRFVGCAGEFRGKAENEALFEFGNREGSGAEEERLSGGRKPEARRVAGIGLRG